MNAIIMTTKHKPICQGLPHLREMNDKHR
jgi:hypothetical protein